MSDHRVSLQPAFLIHQRPFSDTSAIIELFTRDYGRVGILAKGVKRKTSKWRASLQPFQLLQVSWSGKGELPSLTAIESSDTPSIFTGEILFGALYLNELIVRLLHRNDASEDLFFHYSQALNKLAQNTSLSLTLREFELQLLRDLGYEPQLDFTADEGQEVSVDHFYRFVPGVGVFETDAAKGAIPGSHLKAIARNQFEESAVQKSAQRLTRMALDHLLGETPLRTRALFKAFRQQKSKDPVGDQTAD